MIFYKREDMAQVILDFIGSEDFEKAVSCIQDRGRDGFLAGLGMAGTLVMAKCVPYIVEEVTEPKGE